MSEQVAAAALARMNMRDVLVAAHYTSLATDLRMLAEADHEKVKKAFVEGRVEMCAAFGMTSSVQEKPFAFSNGVAIIPISGSLINRFNSCYMGYVTGYGFIRGQFQAAMADPDVHGIIFDVNSFGGEAAGCFELSAEIRAGRSVKPSLAVIDSNCYSGGFALASAASKVVCIPSGGVGSVGVVTMHVDMSKMLDKFGVTVTLIYEAAHKVDGNPYGPLPDDVKAEITASIHKTYEGFVSLVSENLGLDAQAVRDTQSRIYRADDALNVGFIHAIATPIEAARAFLGELSGSTFQLSRKEETAMSTATNEPGAGQQASTGKTAEQAASEARVAERARVSGITGCEEAKGREALANHIAMNTDMSVSDAKAMLAVSPKAEQQAAATPETNKFEQAMNAGKHPNVGADSTGTSGTTELSAADRILAAHSAATGAKYGK